MGLSAGPVIGGDPALGPQQLQVFLSEQVITRVSLPAVPSAPRAGQHVTVSVRDIIMCQGRWDRARGPVHLPGASGCRGDRSARCRGHWVSPVVRRQLASAWSLALEAVKAVVW